MARKVKEISEDNQLGIDIDGDGKSDFSISLKTIGMLVVGIATLIGMWFTLQADIQEAKELPEPVIDRTEYDLKDELIRQTIMDTQDDVDKILEELEKIDERLYELQKNR
jgi:hypothetical protein|tara:strand:- start:109 stop:438 length:330 start_codon:yes stop_codon:yes gene_type:complete